MISVSIVAIGDELLNGFTNDSNTQWIKRRLSNYNVNVIKSIIIPDNSSSIIKATNDAVKEGCDLLVISGGLGPTHDDITKQTLSTYIKSSLVIDIEYLNSLKKRFPSLYDKLKDESNEVKLRKINNMISSQAMIIDNFTAINNKFGTALGMTGKINLTRLVLLAL